MKVIGLMSGTSADGVDAAVVDIRGTGHALRVRPVAYRRTPYPADLQRRVLAASVDGSSADLCHLNAVLGEWFARAALRVIREAGVPAKQVRLIGSHGQTVQHRPFPVHEPGLGLVRSTLQIAEPAIIAERTGITTVANFRARDIAAGGQGAPLTPYVHYLLLRNVRRSRLILNLGGISNVTYLPARGDLASVRAFDTGPGNMVLDGLVRRLTHGRQSMDRGGRLAARGRVDTGLLVALLAHPFFHQKPPKSTGREQFGDAFLTRLLATSRGRRLRPEDLLATCSVLTAIAVGGARRWLTGEVDELIVGGGGARNRTLMADLATVFHPTPVKALEALGWDSKAFEAIAFAVLGYQSIHEAYANVPAVTGATHPVVLGTIVPGKRGRQRVWR